MFSVDTCLMATVKEVPPRELQVPAWTSAAFAGVLFDLAFCCSVITGVACREGRAPCLPAHSDTATKRQYGEGTAYKFY